MREVLGVFRAKAASPGAAPPAAAAQFRVMQPINAALFAPFFAGPRLQLHALCTGAADTAGGAEAGQRPPMPCLFREAMVSEEERAKLAEMERKGARQLVAEMAFRPKEGRWAIARIVQGPPSQLETIAAALGTSCACCHGC